MENTDSGWIQNYRLFAGVYMFMITCIVVYTSGFVPLCSYTVTSWNLVTIRLLFTYLGSLGLSSSPSFQFIADTVRYPALVGCTITVTVWWSVLVPVISHYMPDNESRRKFWIFNRSFPLLNLHLFNLPLCFIEFICTSKCLVYYDLWVALVIAFTYMMFYLNVLDRNGLHFYIVFTPRHVWCIVPYTIMLFSYFGIYHFWNSMISFTSNKICV
jgi:hypothetical protein